jgi:hypothetical protein
MADGTDGVKSSPSARDLALGEGLYPVNGFPGSPSPIVALEEAFPECFGVSPVVPPLIPVGLFRRY